MRHRQGQVVKCPCLQLTIEKLIYGGDGLARGPAGERGRGQAIFVPFVLAGERVEAHSVDDKPGFLRARVDQVLAPSPERIEARCPYFGQCGGCHYQHASYEHQLQIKPAILRETLARAARIEAPEIRVHPSPPWHYRNRARLEVCEGKEFALAYHRYNSRELLPVEYCPISSVLINRAIEAVRRLGRAGQVSSVVQQIEFFAGADDQCLLVDVTLPDGYWTLRCQPTLEEFAAELRGAIPEVAGVAFFRAVSPGVRVRAERHHSFGDDQLIYVAAGCRYRVSAGSFFQTNRFLSDTLIELVTTDRAGDHALDLYAGAGLFTLPLSQTFRQVTAVEAAPFAFHDLKRNAPPNVHNFRGTAEQFLISVVSGLRFPASGSQKPGIPDQAFDLIVAAPPRAGLGEVVPRLLGDLQVPRITYVSCDPATLARDLKALLAAGFRIDELHVVDLFPQTYHLETVAQLIR